MAHREEKVAKVKGLGIVYTGMRYYSNFEELGMRILALLEEKVAVSGTFKAIAG